MPLVRLNFGHDADVPQFRFLTDDEVDLSTFSLGVKNLKEAGLKIGSKWVRDRVGCPEPDEDDEILGEADDDDGEDIPIDPATGLPTEPADPKAKPGEEPANTDKPGEKPKAKD